jgi:hypothetical protein
MPGARLSSLRASAAWSWARSLLSVLALFSRTSRASRSVAASASKSCRRSTAERAS